MANVKDVWFEAIVPFNWLNELDVATAATVARIGISPTGGLHIEYEELMPRPNGRGGITALYLMRLKGKEAVWHATFVALKEKIEALEFGEIIEVHISDIEDPRSLWDFKKYTDEEIAARLRNAKEAT